MMSLFEKKKRRSFFSIHHNIQSMHLHMFKTGRQLLLVLVATVVLYCPLKSHGQDIIPTEKNHGIAFSLNAYSFNDQLMARNSRDSLPVFTLSNLLDWSALQNLEAIDMTGYYFPSYPQVPSDAYILDLRKKAKQLGIAISGTGIRNNFASPDPGVRAADVLLAKKWIEVAAKLGAPVIRLFSGTMPKGFENRQDEVIGWVVSCFKECATHAEKYGVKIGIQNHADMLQNADQCISLLKAIDSKWVGLIVDTGSFTTADPYIDIEKTAPYAINWQVKEKLYGRNPERKTDYIKVMQILKKTGYKGFLPVETLASKGIPYDPFQLVPAMLNEMSKARAYVFNSAE
jgi:sugar phosphate isomerase/epimerase